MAPERDHFMVVPIEHVDVFATIKTKLVEMIDRGGYCAGDKLPAERELATQLNVSRAALREALKVLQATGTVRIVHGSGTFVGSPTLDPIADRLKPDDGFTPEYIHHLTDLRAAIAVRVAELAARNATEEDIGKLAEVLAEMAMDEKESPQSGSLNVSFEEALASIGRNPLLSALQESIDSLWILAWESLRIAPGPRKSLHAEHLQVFEAVRSNDAEAASRLMRLHLDRDVDWSNGYAPGDGPVHD